MILRNPAAGELGTVRPVRCGDGERDQACGALRPDGDDVIPHPMIETTHAITIAAPPSEVWPWLIQGGYRGAGRAGWYSDSWFNWLVENGYLRVTVPPEAMHEKPGVTSADEILPAFQHTAVGDIIPDGPPGSAQFEVRAVDPERAWVLYSDTHIKYLMPTFLHDTRWASQGEFM